MEKIINGIRIGILVAGLLLSVSAGAHAAVSVVAHSSATFDSGSYDEPFDMATDSDGDVFIAGVTGDNDYLTVKYDNALHFVSLATYNGGDVDRAQGIAVDALGYVFVTGLCRNVTGNSDFFTIKYDNNLQVVSSAAFDRGGADDYANGIAVNGAGEIFVTGKSDGHILTLKYENDLTLASTHYYDTGVYEEGWGIAADTAGNVFVTGYHNGDLITIKFDNDLVFCSSATYDSVGGDDCGDDIAIDQAGNVFVSGRQEDDFLAVKYDANLGQISMVSQAAPAGILSTDPSRVAIDTQGNIYVSQAFYETPASFLRMVKYDSDLQVISTAAFRLDNAGYAKSVAVDHAGNAFIAGSVKHDTIPDIVTLKFLPAPSALMISPNSGPIAGGTAVTIDGGGFVSGAAVSIGGRAATDVVFVSSTQITAKTPSSASAGPFEFTVTNPDGQVTPFAGYFTYVGPTVVNSTSTVISAATGGTVFLSPVYGDLSVDIPAGAFSEDVTVTVSTTAVPASGQSNIKVTGIGISITNNKNLQLAQDIQITLRYRNSDIAGFDEDKLAIARYDAGQWVAMNTVVDKDYNAAVCAARGLSIFALVEHSVENSSSMNISNTSGGGVGLLPESGPVLVSIPAGTFGQDVIVTVTTAAVPASSQSAIRTTGIGIEITNSAGLQPNQEITLTVAFRDSDVIGMDESKLTLARYDAEHTRWVVIPTHFVAATNSLIGTVKHLSTFAVVELAPAADLAGVKAYPNPFNPKNGALAITNLTQQAEIKIYAVTGELVRTLPYASADGRALWDGKNDGGTGVASGVYLLFIDGPQGKKKVKIAVER